MPILGQIEMSMLLGESTASTGAASFGAGSIALWVGLGILTIALMVLMRTRWGQAQPLSKCVALSVFAHVLFIAYAYGTRLIFDSPAPMKEEVIRVSFITETDQFDSPDDQALEHDSPSQFAIAADDTTVVESVPQDSFEVAEPDAPEVVENIEPMVEPTPEVTSHPVEPPDLVDVNDLYEPLPEPEFEEPPAIEPSPETEFVEIAPESNATASLDEPTSQQLMDESNSDSIGEAVAAMNDTPDAAVPIAEAAPLVAVTPQVPYPNSSDAIPQPHPSEPPTARPEASTTRVADGAPLPKPYQNRQAQNRLALVERHGASERTEQAVEAALKWLASHQSEDGRWDTDKYGGGRETKVLGHDRKGAGLKADTGITGLALLAFLSAGHTHFEGEYRRNVQHGLEFILSQQAADGNLAGEATFFARMYCHGMATLAICEAYAMTGDDRMKPFVEQAVGYTINSQDPYTGGWRYHPADKGDMSQFGWQVMSLKSAELAGITIPGETRSGMIRFLRGVSKGEHRGLASYRPSGRVSETMTAEALACRFFLGIRQDERSIDEASAFLRRKLPSSGETNLYYWYYGTLGLFQTQAVPSDRRLPRAQSAWPEWNHALQQQLLSKQQRTGDNAGSFSPDTVWGSYGGRVYSTAMATLCLEVYYRYLPLYESPPAAAAASRNIRSYRTLR